MLCIFLGIQFRVQVAQALSMLWSHYKLIQLHSQKPIESLLNINIGGLHRVRAKDAMAGGRWGHSELLSTGQAEEFRQ